MRKQIRVGVVGVGHLGSRHAEIYASMPGIKLSGIYDTDRTKAKKLSKRLKCRAYPDLRSLITDIDAGSLAVPTSLHGVVGLKLLQSDVHLLIEKPISATIAEANALVRTAKKRKLTLQIGHVERFNAAIQAALKRLKHPRFIEVHRLSPYPFRGTDVSVLLDVMIHDIDLLLALVRSPITKLDAVGISVLSKSEDIANARLRFASGCIADLTASRISDESTRRFRVFQEDSYLSIDSKAQTVELAQKSKNTIRRVQLPVNQRPPLQDELAAFIRCVRTKQPPLVSGSDGQAALALALRIERVIRRSRVRSSELGVRSKKQ